MSLKHLCDGIAFEKVSIWKTSKWFKYRICPVVLSHRLKFKYTIVHTIGRARIEALGRPSKYVGEMFCWGNYPDGWLLGLGIWGAGVGLFGGFPFFFFFFPSPQKVSSVSINKLGLLDAGMWQTHTETLRKWSGSIQPVEQKVNLRQITQHVVGPNSCVCSMQREMGSCTLILLYQCWYFLLLGRTIQGQWRWKCSWDGEI